MQKARREAKLPLFCGKIKHCKKQQWCIGLALLLLPTFLVKRQTNKSRSKRKRNGKVCPYAVGLQKPPLSWKMGGLIWKSSVGCGALGEVQIPCRVLGKWNRTFFGGPQCRRYFRLLKQHYLFGYAPLSSVSSHTIIWAVKNLDLLRLLGFQDGACWNKYV